MRTHTNDFKNAIKEFGRELDSKLTYVNNGNTITLGSEELNNITPKVESSLLKSVMKELNIDSNVDIPIDTELNYQFGVKTRSGKNLFNINGDINTRYNGTTGTSNTTSNEDLITTLNLGNYIPYGQKIYVGIGNTATISLKGKTITASTTPVGSSNVCACFIYNDNTTSGVKSIVFTYDELGTTKSTKFTPTTDYIYVTFGRYSNVTNATFTDIQVEIGTQATSYEKYGMYDYIDYGNYIVYSSEYSADNNAYVIKAYDKMLYSMKEYTTLQSAEFPLTIREYISALCSDLSNDDFTLVFANENDTFVNYNKVLQTDPYANISYTYRDILDDLAETTASNICINSSDKLELRYINDTENNTPSANLFNPDYYKYAQYSINVYKYTNSNIKGDRTLWVKCKLKEGKTAVSGLYVCLSSKPNPNSTGAIYKMFIYNGGTANTGSQNFTGEENLYFSFYPTTTTLNQIFDNYDLWVSTNNINYIPFTYDSIDEEYLKDVNVNFGKLYGPINTIVLSRSEDSDKFANSSPANLQDEDKIALNIKDNLIMNGDDRGEYIPDILNQLLGLQFYINDYTSTGIMYYEVCDRYTVSINETNYTCILFNDEQNITQGLVEHIDTPEPETSENDYKYITADEKVDRTTKLIVDKANNRIDAQAREINIIATNINKENGDINAVTTKEKHFTFNDNGLTISAGENDFKSVSDETGTYYYDGTTKVGEYTKDGSKQKDLSLFGAYKYGMDEITDTPMFVAQLYTKNGNEGVGHFYNGGDI